MDPDIVKIEYTLLDSFSSKQLKGEQYFPIGIKIIKKDDSFFMRSRINDHLKIYISDIDRITKNDKELKKIILSGFCSEKMFKEIVSKKIFPLYHLLEDETVLIKKIFEDKGKYYNSYVTQELLEKDYRKYLMEISNIFDDSIKSKYKEELQLLFLKSIDKEEDKELFKVVNYLIHFINWNNSFYNFYDSSLEIISGTIRMVEHHLSPELINCIKAYRAYYAQINVIKRLLEKREKGKISTLSILDWQTDIKDFLVKHFASFFGKAKAIEYIECLDGILQKNLTNN